VTTPKNRRSRSRGARRPQRVLTALATGLVAASVWWLSSVQPAGEPVRASLSLSEWPAQQWNPLRSSFFQLKRVEFLGLEQLSGEHLAQALDLDARALIDVDPQNVCRELLEQTARLQGCQASRMLPSRLLVSLNERRPIARLADAPTGFDAQGVAFELGPQEGAQLPLLSGELEPALRALQAAQGAGLAVRSAHAGAQDVLLVLQDATRLRMGADPQHSLAAWRALLDHLHPAELGSIVEVDTSFPSQVIVRVLEREQAAYSAGGNQG
jgi:hypothetical protein